MLIDRDINAVSGVFILTCDKSKSQMNVSLNYLGSIFVVQKSYRDFRLQGVLDGTLNNKSYETVYNRLTIEEATAAVSAADGLQGITMRDSDEEEG